jgi:hypothetical protein
MTLVIGLAMIVAGVVVGVLQVRWAERQGGTPTSLGEVSGLLPDRVRTVSSVAIAGLLVAGALIAGNGRPWWVHYLAIIGGGVATAGAQALAVRRNRSRPGTPRG